MLEDTTPTTEFKESKNLPFTACVPSQVILDPNINDAAKVTYALIATMLLRDGYATCSDKWLATHRQCSLDKIQECLKALEDAGYIYRQTWKEGMYSKRRIWRSDCYAKYLLENNIEDEKFKKCLRIGKFAYLERANSPTSSGQIRLSNNKQYKDKKRKQASRVREPAAAAFVLKNYISQVPEKFHKRIQQEFDRRTDIHNPVGWITQCVGEKWYESWEGSKEGRTQTNRELASKIKEKFIDRHDIHLGVNYLEFVNGFNSPSTFIIFDNPKFEDICQNELKKRRLAL